MHFRRSVGFIPSTAIAAIALCHSASATATEFTTFSISVIMGTDTFESSDGTVLFTENDLYVTNVISPTLTSLIQTDTGVPTFIAANIGSFDLVSDGTFLSTVTANALLTQSGNLIKNIDAAGFPPSAPLGQVQDLTDVSFDGSVTDETLDQTYSASYLLSGSVGDQDWEGVVNVYYYALDVTETEAVPEPSSLPLLAAGFLGVLSFVRRRKRV